jgi:hypothetical protein
MFRVSIKAGESHFSPRTREAQKLAQALLQTREWRQVDMRDNHLGSGAMPQTMERAALGPSWRMGRPKMEPVQTPKQRQKEEEKYE